MDFRMSVQLYGNCQGMNFVSGMLFRDTVRNNVNGDHVLKSRIMSLKHTIYVVFRSRSINYYIIIHDTLLFFIFINLLKGDKSKMKKENLKKTIGKVMGQMAVSIAKMEANSACPYLSYQPKKPNAVKKLRNF